ncbi:alpha/beta hydrolase [Chitinophaga sp. 22321]|uniref:Alpha/beta hydrolase n=1 Tax=Chitinophaga hostae TaxID=2831022 RepID=A0ABS5J854_9BACT|nr:alpha/beta hydrolase [Chitinophaga hostae]MBS0031365.1 alpha/beta hydrolase [Chitinophaga hostae]
MEILPQVQEALTYIKSVKVSIGDKLQASRVSYERLIPLAGQQDAVFAVEDRSIIFPDRKINIRIYRPSNHKALPALVYFHGGGFFKGSIESHDRPLRQLANLSGVVIISVDYRLAPEYPFPHGLNDCIDTTAWIMNHATELGINSHRMAVAGDSAGGTLATAVAGKLDKILCQVLIYPATDSSLATPSWSEFADGPVLTLKSAVELWEYYTEDKIKAAPIFNDDLSGMPDAFIITAEYDPLRDEAGAYAKKLRDANVEVTEKVYPKMIHGFFQMGGVIDQGREAIANVAGYIRYKLAA